MDLVSQSNHLLDRPTRRHVLRGLLAAGLTLVAAPVLAACGGAQPAGAQAGGKSAAKGTAAGVTIEMNDQNKFVPDRVTVPRGSTVTWKNIGTMVHNVVAGPSKAADKSHANVPSGAQPFASEYITAGQSWPQKFDVAGEYTYFCQPHEALGMVATIIVE